MKEKTFKKRILSLVMVFAMLLSVIATYFVPTETTLADETNEYATVVGDMSQIGVSSVSWDPASNDCRMEYLGNGYFYKEITFAETTQAKDIQFKIAFNGSWSKNIGKDGSNTDNFVVKVPVGVSSIQILANVDVMRAYNSIQDAALIKTVLKTFDRVDKGPYGLVTLAGSFDTLSGSGFGNWDPTGGNGGVGVMEYLGQGYYYKEVTFDALSAAKSIEFKAVFGGAWGNGDVGKDGKNYSLSIPVGESAVGIYLDATNKVIYTTVEHADEIAKIWNTVQGPHEIAVIAGNFDTFTGSGQSNWNAAGGSNGEGLMEYLGKGYYYKKITFDKLSANKTAEFKAVFGGDWGKEGDFGNGGSNYVLTVPAESTYVEIIADTNEKKIYTSVERPDAIASVLKGEDPAPYAIAVIAGNFDTFSGSGQLNWNAAGGSNGEGLMKYLGKGYYYKKITFDKLSANKTAEFKAVFGGDWGKEGDFGNGGSNYVLTVPAESTYVEIIADTKEKKIYTSVEHADVITNILKGENPEGNNPGGNNPDVEDPAPYEIAVIAGDFDKFSGSGQSNWNPAGGANGAGLMKYIGKGYYYKKITFNKLANDQTAEFKVVFGGGWDVQGQFGKGSDNYVLKVPAGSTEVEIIVDATGRKIFTSVEHPSAIEAILKGEKPPVEEQVVLRDITIRFANTQNWSKVNAYAWDGSGTKLNGDWPGGEITKDGDVYVWTYKNWNIEETINIIFNGSDSQTVDLSINKDDLAISTDWTFTPVSNANGNWECKKIDKAPYNVVVIAGDFNNFANSGQSNWAADGGANGAGLMEYVGKGYYYKKITFDELTESKDASFKIVPGGSWGQDFGDDGQNYAITVPAGATYVEIAGNVNTKKIYTSVEDPEAIASILKGEEPVEKPAEMQIIDGKIGTTKFIAVADKNKKVTLYYGVKSEVEAKGTAALKTAVMKADKKNTYVSDELFLGDGKLDYVFYFDVAGTRVLNDNQETVTIGGKAYSRYTRDAFTGRKVTLPGTFPGASWDTTSNQMTYVGNGIYKYTFKNLPAATYQYKVAIGGSWTENYGYNGIKNSPSDNISVFVPVAQDVTIYYSDFSHLTVNSVDYIFADVTLTGSGINETVKLTDDDLRGIYSAQVTLSAGSHTNYKITCGSKEYAINAFNLKQERTVTFYYDPMTEVYYHDASENPIKTGNVYYTTKDKNYKSVYGSVEQNKEVTFTINTGTDATSVILVVKGCKNVSLEKAALADGVQKWTATTSFDRIGEYDYYFVISNGESVAVYCDDEKYAGEGKVAALDNCNPYDLVVHEEGFETPDWMKNAVIYQIFPDRFYNGNIENDQAQESARGEVDYEFVDDWYLLPENPEQKDLLTEEQYKAHGAFYGDGNWSNEIYGGDLEGIYERIDYLKALGVNVIYLNPIFSSISNHRYDACDYAEIDPILGTLGDFEDLVRFAEENGMKIILDGVFNHVSDDSIYFDRYYKFLGKSEKIGAYPYWAYVYDYMAEEKVNQAAAEKAAKDYFTAEYGITDYSYTEWFAVSNAQMVGGDGKPVKDNIGLRAGKEVYTYEGWWGYDSMPVIYSTNGSEYQTGNWAEEIIYNEDGTSVTQYWISKGNNGWRLDVANEVSDETWQEFRDAVKALDSDAVIIGEIWDDATHYLMGDMYDSVMNYVFRTAVTGFAKGGSAAAAMEELEKIRERYPEEAFYAMMNLVGSHDTTRVLSFLDGIDDDRKQTDEASAFPTYETTSDLAKQRQYLVALMQFTYAGAPTIYYGDEIGMVGSDDPDDRRAMEWGKGNKELVTWYATLAAIRAQHDVLRTGSVEPIVVNNNVMGYVRRDADEVMIILVNNATSDKEVTIDLSALKVDADKLTDLLTNKAATITDGKLTITVPAVNGVILSDTVKTYTVDQENLAPAYDPEYIGGADLTPDEPERPQDPKPEDPKPEDPKPEEPKPEEPKDEVIKEEGSGIEREDVVIAEDNKNNEVVKEDDGKETVVLGNDKMPDLTIKAETTVVDEEAFFVRQYLVEGELFKETVAQMEKKLKEVENFKMVEINLYSGEGTQMTQLKGYVEVTIPVPTDIKVKEGNVLAVYRVNDDGSFTNCNATIKDGKLTFRTNHFSTFVIVEQAKTAVVPQTGDNSATAVYFFVLLAGLAVAMTGVVNKRKYVK